MILAKATSIAFKVDIISRHYQWPITTFAFLELCLLFELQEGSYTEIVRYCRLGLQRLVNIIDNIENKKLSTNIFVVE